MRRLAVSIGKILLFLALWAGLVAAVTMTAVQLGGEESFADLRWRYLMEAGAAAGVFVALLVMAFLIDKRGWNTIGLPARAERTNPLRALSFFLKSVFGVRRGAPPARARLRSAPSPETSRCTRWSAT